ncbi:MAG: bifunctional [glutamine synthetase] adenylyltransferase/[glutamine synthetase]-adenylyl-L-tyrosine phosphorylase [Acidimicrobiia bacterium]
MPRAAASPVVSTDVAAAIAQAPDPRLATTVVDRLIEAHPALRDELAANSTLRDGVIALACASRSLSSAFIADPSMLDPLRDAIEFVPERGPQEYATSWNAVAGDATALRKWKRRELLRIAARDLLGFADLATVGRELAALGGETLDAALRFTSADADVAIVGMGKLGGRELNYSSDVDVLFVHDGNTEEAERAAREVLATMSEPSADGIVFRTDANLRPEGRSGPLTRTVESYVAYYEHWGRTWEFQALLKGRAVAGNHALGARLTDATRRFVWPDALDPDAVREIRAMKERAEAVTMSRGLSERELKRGRGGIRDIEFAVQLLQLVHGRHDESVRSPTTLDALAALAAGGYIDIDDATNLDAAYQFLRTVEHRIQLFDETQTHTVPSDDATRTRLARVLGYRGSPQRDELAAFDADQRAHQQTVRAIHERLFFAPLLEALAGVGDLAPAAVEERLTAFGFTDLARTRAAVRELAGGLTRRSKLLQQLMPLILEWLSTSPDPDLGLLQLRLIAEGPARSASLAVTFRDAPGIAERACRLLGSSRVVGEALRRHPEFVEDLGDDDELHTEKSRAAFTAAAMETLEWRADPLDRREGLRRFKRRELLRIASRDLLGFAPTSEVGRELTSLAEAALEGALDGLASPVPFAVIGMGRLGGGELSYASDIDVVFVYDGDTDADFDAAERVATQLVAEIGETTSEGQTFRIDARLRPEGSQGPLARSLAGYERYYDRWGLTWERQALVKARFVAGDPELGQRFCDLATRVVYDTPFTEGDAREVRRSKARVERERIPPGEDHEFHLKLGRGTLTDVEFCVQLLQLQHGGVNRDLRVSGTINALHAVHDASLITADELAALVDTYEFCARARNALYLNTGRQHDGLPSDGIESERLGRLLGYVHEPQATLRDTYRRVTRRARRVVEHVFFETP